MQPIQDIFPLLPQPRRVVITTHQKPDADAMGSSLALAGFLKSFGHQVTVISPTNWAQWLDWMPGCKEVIDFEANKTKVATIISEAEWLFCLDFNIFHRTKHLAPLLAGASCVKILIDHHQEPDAPSFQYGISDTAKSSTCEMIYDLILASGYSDRISEEIGECIYAGVIADTGSFRFPAAGASVHRLAADLKQRGLDHSRVHSQLFDNFLENKLRFTGHVLLHRMEVMYEYNTALVAITKGDLLRYHIRTGDTEGLVNFPQSIQGIKLVGLVIDRDEERKWSFRSKGEFDCNTFARKYFEGGGHYNAAGGRSSDPLEETVRKFKQAIEANKSLLQ
ncbi:MAG TPA: DHH family phosphoesterase, partial [Chitinophagaceae bacterium]|nr:DHH family phosphoesterase [Chitinophagaceae bacterium]